MKLIIDGKEYDFDADWLVGVWQDKTAAYLDPARPDARKFADVRLALKGLLRLHLPKVLQLFADVFQIADWRLLKPGKGDDLLLKLHGYMALVMHAEAQNITLELRSVRSVEDSDGHALEDGAATQLALTGAALGGHVLYQREPEPEPGSELPERPAAPALPEKTGA